MAKPLQSIGRAKQFDEGGSEKTVESGDSMFSVVVDPNNRYNHLVPNGRATVNNKLKSQSLLTGIIVEKLGLLYGNTNVRRARAGR